MAKLQQAFATWKFSSLWRAAFVGSRRPFFASFFNGLLGLTETLVVIFSIFLWVLLIVHWHYLSTNFFSTVLKAPFLKKNKAKVLNVPILKCHSTLFLSFSFSLSHTRIYVYIKIILVWLENSASLITSVMCHCFICLAFNSDLESLVSV